VRRTVPGLWSPIALCISCRDTKAWTTPKSVNPKISAHSVAQNMKNPSARL